jgi:hypothetical protein
MKGKRKEEEGKRKEKETGEMKRKSSATAPRKHHRYSWPSPNLTPNP